MPLKLATKKRKKKKKKIKKKKKKKKKKISPSGVIFQHFQP